MQDVASSPSLGGVNLGKSCAQLSPAAAGASGTFLFPESMISTRDHAVVPPRQLAPSVGNEGAGAALPAVSTSSLAATSVVLRAPKWTDLALIWSPRWRALALEFGRCLNKSDQVCHFRLHLPCSPPPARARSMEFDGESFSLVRNWEADHGDLVATASLKTHIRPLETRVSR